MLPNPVHGVVRPREGQTLPKILHSWKSFSANACNKVLRRKGAFWQAEDDDHWVRDDEDFAHSIAYALNNPEAAGLKTWKGVGGASGMTGVAWPSRP